MKNKDRFKFRVWDKLHKEYIDFKILNFGEYLIMPERYIVEQCTGVKAGNGKLIFEGDILATSNTQPEAAEDYWTKEQYGYTTVVWNDEFLCFACTEWNFEPFGIDSVYSLEFVEVAGNIHENPELLER